MSAMPIQDSPASEAVSAASFCAEVATVAERCLRLEIETWPKPGLVSHVDSGSHHDMDAAMFLRSASVLRPFFAELVEAGMHAQDMRLLRKIGLRAESAMFKATGGINTHRGAIFGLGLLSAAVGLRVAGHVDATKSLGDLVQWRWGADILGGPRLPDSHGEIASRRYGAAGARHEAATGFPSVYDIGLPMLSKAAAASNDAHARRVQACFALIAAVEDTNLLHRGGEEGLQFAQRCAQAFLDRGGVAQSDWLNSAVSAHRAFVSRRLSPGGAADLLAMSLFVSEMEQRDAFQCM